MVFKFISIRTMFMILVYKLCHVRIWGVEVCLLGKVSSTKLSTTLENTTVQDRRDGKSSV